MHERDLMPIIFFQGFKDPKFKVDSYFDLLRGGRWGGEAVNSCSPRVLLYTMLQNGLDSVNFLCFLCVFASVR